VDETCQWLSDDLRFDMTQEAVQAGETKVKTASAVSV